MLGGAFAGRGVTVRGYGALRILLWRGIWLVAVGFCGGQARNAGPWERAPVPSRPADIEFILAESRFLNLLHRPSKLKFHVHDLANMTSWMHLARFIAMEDHEIDLGQLIDTSRDIDLDSLNNIEIQSLFTYAPYLAMPSQSKF